LVAGGTAHFHWACRVLLVEGEVQLVELVVPALVAELALPERLLDPDDVPLVNG